MVTNGPTLGASDQLWQMNEANKLIWPAPPADGSDPNWDVIGITPQDSWDRTVGIAQNTPNLEVATVLTAPPTDGAYTNEIVTLGWQLLQGQGYDLITLYNAYWPIDVTLNEGGSCSA